jgi:DNA-binding transcriptional MerR regulator
MPTRLVIGEFSRATKLSIKTLRHYHQAGLLEPAEIDPDSGYRYYSVEQLPAAQIIRRLRGLQMPVADVKAVLTTTDAEARNRLIVAHLGRLESELAATREATTELRALLERPQPSLGISTRTVPATTAIAIEETVDYDGIAPWWQGALAELHAQTETHRLEPTGAAAGIYAAEIFQRGRGQATVYIPVGRTPRPGGAPHHERSQKQTSPSSSITAR